MTVEPGGSRYKIIEELGQGAMATVYLARDLELDRRVALKILKSHMAGRGPVVARLLREARIAASLRHPNLLRLHDVGENNGIPFLVMEYIEGLALSEILEAGALPGRRAVEVAEQIARGVHAAHQGGVIHRDLKPANIMVENSGRVVVMDFGLAHLDESEHSLTRTGAILGTPYYMSPEQVRGETRDLDPRTDIYALGAILHEMLTGSPPHTGASVAEIYRKILNEDPVTIRGRAPKVPAMVEQICRKAMSRDRVDRYPTAEAMAEDLQMHLRGISAEIRTVRRLAPRKKNALILGSILLILGSGILALWLAGNRVASRADEVRNAMIGQMLSTSETCLAAALELRRLGDLDGMNRQAAAVETACRTAIAAYPGLAEPHYRWGRMLRARMRFDEAFEQQDQALARDPSHPGARHERGLLTVHRYHSRMNMLGARWHRNQADEAQGRPGAIQQLSPSTAQLEDDDSRRLKRNATADFEALSTAAARAFQELLRGNDVEAGTFFRASLQETGGTEEEFEWLAFLSRRTGQLDEAEMWLTRGIQSDRGYIPYLTARARIRNEQADVLDLQRIDSSGKLLAAVEDLEEVLRLDPQRVDSLCDLGETVSVLGSNLALSGKNGRPFQDRAIQIFGRLLAADPDNVMAWNQRGHLRSNIGLRLKPGEDPTPVWTEAVSDFTEGLRRDPENAGMWGHRGNLAQRNSPRDRFDESLFDSAARDIDEAIRYRPTADLAWKYRASVYRNWGAYRSEFKREHESYFQKALSDMDEAIRLQPLRDSSWRERAQIRLFVLISLSRRSADMARQDEVCRQIIDDATRALSLNPTVAECHYFRARGYGGLGRYKEAMEDFTAAVTLNPLLEPGYRKDIEQCRRRLKE